MNSSIREIFGRAEGRYFNESEAAQLLGYADQLAAHLDPLQAIERAEGPILDDVVAAVMAAHPDIRQRHGDGGEAYVRRDQALVLRYAALAMVMVDPDFVHDKLAVWLRSILGALCATEHVTTGYRALIEACHRHLVPADAAAVVPYVRIVLDRFETTAAGRAA